MLGEDTISSPIKINIAESFNDYFVNVGPAMASSTDGCQTNFERYHNKVDNILFAFQTISYSKVFKLLEKLIVSKATGIDKIPARILKIAAPVITTTKIAAPVISQNIQLFYRIWGISVRLEDCSSYSFTQKRA